MIPRRFITAVGVVIGLSVPAQAATMAKLRQCRYEGPVLTTCSALLDNEGFKICNGNAGRKAPAYTITGLGQGMHKVAVEIRRDGRTAPYYRRGQAGLVKAGYRFSLSGLEHFVGTDTMLVMERRKSGTHAQVWMRVRCKEVDVDVDALERKAIKDPGGD